MEILRPSIEPWERDLRASFDREIVPDAAAWLAGLHRKQRQRQALVVGAMIVCLGSGLVFLIPGFEFRAHVDVLGLVWAGLLTGGVLVYGHISKSIVAPIKGDLLRWVAGHLGDLDLSGPGVLVPAERDGIQAIEDKLGEDDKIVIDDCFTVHLSDVAVRAVEVLIRRREELTSMNVTEPGGIAFLFSVDSDFDPDAPEIAARLAHLNDIFAVWSHTDGEDGSVILRRQDHTVCFWPTWANMFELDWQTDLDGLWENVRRFYSELLIVRETARFLLTGEGDLNSLELRKAEALEQRASWEALHKGEVFERSDGRYEFRGVVYGKRDEAEGAKAQFDRAFRR